RPATTSANGGVAPWMNGLRHAVHFSALPGGMCSRTTCCRNATCTDDTLTSCGCLRWDRTPLFVKHDLQRSIAKTLRRGRAVGFVRRQKTADVVLDGLATEPRLALRLHRFFSLHAPAQHVLRILRAKHNERVKPLEPSAILRERAVGWYQSRIRKSSLGHR